MTNEEQFWTNFKERMEEDSFERWIRFHEEDRKLNLPKNDEESLLLFPEAKDIVEEKQKKKDLTKDQIDKAKQVPIDKIVGMYVPVLKSGTSRYIVKCPIHGESTASLVLYKKTNSFYCFGCHKTGDTIKFVMLMDKLSFLEAVKKIVS